MEPLVFSTSSQREGTLLKKGLGVTGCRLSPRFGQQFMSKGLYECSRSFLSVS